MMNTMKSRSGSALLIVLGMLSFMVVSAVGFSVYMRQSRVPSSHLRREASARYLLKSALANAVARIDGTFNTTFNRVEGVYDNPYPGLIDSNYTPGGYNEYNGDYWNKRIFSPFGLVSPAETVSTLSLEGLAYIPPALINEARVYSRSTRTAKWTNLAYDLGRYAFCAIDVSDCFDINKLGAIKRRTSAPGERISLASLFPDEADSLANKLASKAGNVPYVSIADYNIAFGTDPHAPFYKYIQNGGNNGHIYLQGDHASVSNALFITDTWFPRTNAYLTADLEVKRANDDNQHFFDLSTKEGQPYEDSDFGLSRFLEIPVSKPLQKALMKNLGGVGLACLYDYLDEDSIPISLALPTTESVPMVCGINLAGSMSMKFEKNAAGLPQGVEGESDWEYIDQKGDAHQIKRKVDAICFRGADLENLQVAGTVIYPFKRMGKDKRKQSYKVQALMAVFFASDDMKCRLKNSSFRPTKNDWSSGGVRDGIVFYKSEAMSLSFEDDVSSTDRAIASFHCALKETSATMPAYYHVTEVDKTPGVGTSINPLPAGVLQADVITVDGLQNQRNAFTYYDREGKVPQHLKDMRKGKIYNATERHDNAGQTKQNPVGDIQGTYKPYVALWVRVTDSSGKTVDLAPATFPDDEIHLDGCKYGEVAENTEMTALSGSGVALLDLKGEGEFKYDDQILETFKGTTPFEGQGWKSFLAVDPRYNFAPEDWMGIDQADASKEVWKNRILNNGGVFGVDGRDRDIFMFTSDQEHLQSIGELQFLPFVQELGRGDASMLSCQFQKASRYHGENNFGSRSTASLNAFANGTRFWRTYSGYAVRGWNYGANDPYYDICADDGKRIEIVNGTNDFRVNPLSPDPRAVSAAIFDTPWDYYVASTNKPTNKALTSVSGSPESYAFGTEAGLNADRWTEKVISAISGRMSNEIRAEARHDMANNNNRTGGYDWGLAYEDLDWEGIDHETKVGDEQTYLFGDVNLGTGHPLHGVDRKFLFSYWRECFQNRQQLFLIFLRAEPLTVGGAGGDSLASSQLGARGVALVWRDPDPPRAKGTTEKRLRRSEIGSPQQWREQMKLHAPHRTRVLFYHQFD